MCSGSVQDVAFHPTDPNIVASCSNDKTIKIWNLATLECKSTMRGHDCKDGCLCTREWAGVRTSTLGLRWKQVGLKKPDTGNEIQNEALASALGKKAKPFTKEEWDKFKMSGVSCDSFLKVGDRYFSSTLGLRWKQVGLRKPDTGNEILNKALASALMKKAKPFTKEEWDKLKVSDVSCDSYVKVGDRYFKPTVSSHSQFQTWKQVGLKRPDTGKEIQNEALASAIGEKEKLFTKEEWDKLKVSDVSCDSYVKVGDRYFKPTAINLPQFHSMALNSDCPVTGHRCDSPCDTLMMLVSSLFWSLHPITVVLFVPTIHTVFSLCFDPIFFEKSHGIQRTQ